MTAMAILEIMIWSLDSWLNYSVLKIIDIGGTIIIHMFAGVFGMTISIICSPKSSKTHKNLQNNYFSDQFTMIGVIFLWFIFFLIYFYFI
jgi:ammonia channel protein AmtB